MENTYQLAMAALHFSSQNHAVPDGLTNVLEKVAAKLAVDVDEGVAVALLTYQADKNHSQVGELARVRAAIALAINQLDNHQSELNRLHQANLAETKDKYAKMLAELTELANKTQKKFEQLQGEYAQTKPSDSSASIDEHELNLKVARDALEGDLQAVARMQSDVLDKYDELFRSPESHTHSVLSIPYCRKLSSFWIAVLLRRNIPACFITHVV